MRRMNLLAALIASSLMIYVLKVAARLPRLVTQSIHTQGTFMQMLFLELVNLYL